MIPNIIFKFLITSKRRNRCNRINSSSFRMYHIKRSNDVRCIIIHSAPCRSSALGFCWMGCHVVTDCRNIALRRVQPEKTIRVVAGNQT